MVFHIGQQNGGVVNNVGRDQTVHGGQQGSCVPSDVRQALADLHAALGQAPLAQETLDAARAEIETASSSVDRPQPDRERAAGALERFTRLLTSVGALTSAAAALVGPLQTLGNWLGPLGARLLSFLPTVS